MLKHQVIAVFGRDALLMRDTAYGKEYIAAHGYDRESGTWLQGSYTPDLSEALAKASSSLGKDGRPERPLVLSPAQCASFESAIDEMEAIYSGAAGCDTWDGDEIAAGVDRELGKLIKGR